MELKIVAPFGVAPGTPDGEMLAHLVVKVVIEGGQASIEIGGPLQYCVFGNKEDHRVVHWLKSRLPVACRTEPWMNEEPNWPILSCHENDRKLTEEEADFVQSMAAPGY